MTGSLESGHQFRPDPTSGAGTLPGRWVSRRSAHGVRKTISGLDGQRLSTGGLPTGLTLVPATVWPTTTHVSSARLRRSTCLLGAWEYGEFVVEHYITAKRTMIAPAVAESLVKLGELVPIQEVVQMLAPIPCADEVVDRLIAQDILVVEGSPLDQKERLLETWKWGHAARHFHYATQHAVYGSAPLGPAPAPSPYKDYGRADVALTRPVRCGAGQFFDILSSRRTRRAYTREPLSLDDLSTILFWTWGKTHSVDDPDLGEFILKATPSGGARHPIEVYPIVLRVRGVEPGIYHYSVLRHDLEQLRSGMFDERVVELCEGQTWVGDAAVVFLMTAVVGRSMWKYENARAYRVLLLDAGHLGQTFHLVCTRLGLAPFTTAATSDAAIEADLAIDGVTEIPVYVAAVGHPE